MFCFLRGEGELWAGKLGGAASWGVIKLLKDFPQYKELYDAADEEEQEEILAELAQHGVLQEIFARRPEPTGLGAQEGVRGVVRGGAGARQEQRLWTVSPPDGPGVCGKEDPGSLWASRCLRRKEKMGGEILI